MTSTTLQLSDDYLLHITVLPVVTGGYHLKIESQWLGAKDPAGRQTRYTVNLPQRELLELAATLTEGAA